MGISLQSQDQLKTVQTEMKDTESNICQIAVIKDGSLVLSETYNCYSKDECCHIASATKSIVGLSEGYSMNLLPDGHSSCASTQRNVSYNIRLPMSVVFHPRRRT